MMSHDGLWWPCPLGGFPEPDVPLDPKDKQIESLYAKANELYEALLGIIEIGKRNTENPKYDGYYERARSALTNYKA